MTQQRQNYIISYTAYDKSGKVLKADGQMRVKNKLSKFEAQCSFEEHLKKKYANFGKLVVHSCTVDFMGGMFGNQDIIDNFNKIFGGFNK